MKTAFFAVDVLPCMHSDISMAMIIKQGLGKVCWLTYQKTLSIQRSEILYSFWDKI